MGRNVKYWESKLAFFYLLTFTSWRSRFLLTTRWFRSPCFKIKPNLYFKTERYNLSTLFYLSKNSAIDMILFIYFIFFFL